MNQDTTKIKYFLYARKSSESDDRQVQSIDDQINKLKELAKDSDLEIIKVLTESKSAKQPNNRPIFENMLAQIEKGKAQGILCWQINRLSRNPVDSGKINWMLQQGTIKSIQTIDKQYLPEDNVLMFSMESGMSNQFILDLRKNTKRGLEGKVQRGEFPAKAPQGYTNDVINKTIIKDPERFELIKKMWSLMLTGSCPPSKILDIANNEWGYRTKKTKRAGARPMSQSELYRIFNDPFYYGYFKYKGKISKGIHEPMITIEEFERVQELFGRKDRPQQKTHEFSFTGIIRCGHCGCLITAEEKRKFIKCTQKYANYTYYRCTRRKRELNCQEPAITMKNLEEQIIKEIDKYTIPLGFKDWALEVLKVDNGKEIERRNQSYEMLNNTYLSLQKQLDNLTNLRLRDLIDDDDFIKRKEELQNEVTKARERLNQNQDRGQNWIELIERAFNFAVYAREKFITTKDLQIKREILSALGQVYTLKSGELSIEPSRWLISISNLNKIAENETRALEPANNVLYKTKNRSVVPAFSKWGRLGDVFRTLDWNGIRRDYELLSKEFALI
ncbi:MAG: recombinase family protein [Candidatus Paceibacterota bacterium]